MAVTPQTELRLIKLGIELDDKNQLTHASKTSQANYFLSLPHLEVDNFTYQRRDNVIRYPEHIDNIIMYNYCMYQNENYTDKWFYCYITNMRYVNDNMTEITIKTDVFQTWQFDLEYKQSFVEREHVSDDTIGLHTIPEGLETGEYIASGKTTFGVGSCHAVVALTEDPFRAEGSYPYQKVNGIPTGLHYFVCGDFTSVNFIGWITEYIQQESDPSILQGIFLVPDTLTGYDETSHDYWKYAIEGGFSYAPYHKMETRTNNSVNMENKSINKAYTNIDGYTPKNNKLFTGEYNYLLIDNNNGGAFNYKYEDFSTNNCVFDVEGALSFGCSIRCIPKNYKGVEKNNSEGINAGKLPIGSWSTDVFTNWLTQNGVNNALAIGAGVAQIGLGVASTATGAGALAGVGAVASGVGTIASTMGTIYQHSFVPRQVEGNTNAGDVTYSMGESTFTAYNMHIKREYAQAIDEFFSMFGYKTHRVKVPNINNRPNWNYVKLIDANIHGYVPGDDMNEIKNLFNQGITLWHNPGNFLNYQANNK